MSLCKIKYYIAILLICMISSLSFASSNNGLDSNSAVSGSPKIVGGHETVPGAWPWMAALVRSTSDSLYSSQICGASLIHPEWAITAAHCVENKTSESINVVLDVHNLKTDPGQRIKIKRIIPHPDYNSYTEDSDIALLELEQRCSQTPLSLVRDDVFLLGKEAIAIGWGVTDPNAYESPETLQQVSLPIVSNEVCKESYDADEITDTMICAGYPEGGKDSCWGDSGGPLVVQDGTEWKLAGVVSWGSGCAEPGYYGVYARIPKLIDFIYKYVADITLTIPAAAKEGDGILREQGIISLREPLTSTLVIHLSSDNASELSIPESISISTGHTLAVFDINIIDDVLLDGTQSVTITADGLEQGMDTAAIHIHDNETAMLNLSIPSNASEGEVLKNQGTVSASQVLDSDVSVSLTSDDTSEVIVPQTVTIPSNQSRATFDLTIVYDGESDGTQEAEITASVEGWTSGSARIEVENENRDYLTQEFDRDNDLAYQRLIFIPDGSSSFYSLCNEDVSAFSTNPENGTPIFLSDDDYQKISLSQDKQVSFFGSSYSSFYVGSNGYITFDSGDTDYSESLSDHFNLPRISALFDDLYPNKITWQALDNRVVVTYQGGDNFQIELFFDGRICITYLELSSNGGIVGLSRGGGEVSDFVSSDLNAYGSCHPYLFINVPESIFEGENEIVEQCLVSLENTQDKDLSIHLTSGDPSKVQVPETIILEKRQSSVPFELTLLKDTLVNGTQRVSITASADDYNSATGMIYIYDNESAKITVSVPEQANEGDGVLYGKGQVTVNPAPDTDVEIALSSSDMNEVTVPDYITIPAGQTTVNFNLTIIYDRESDGTETVNITAEVPGWISGNDTIDVINQDIEYFTEEFDDDNDLSNQSFTFTPDGSQFFYTVCRESISAFFTDPEGGTVLSLGDDDYQKVILSQGHSVSLYGESYSSFYVGSNGYITFQSGGTDYSESLADHFECPRISALFDDLYGGEITWKELDDRAVVTYDNLEGNSFQIEMFFTGVIRLTYLDIYESDGIVGLSEGKGMPENFIESDFAGYVPCLPLLHIDIPDTAAEGDGQFVKQGIISVADAPEKDLLIYLSSSDSSEILIPEDVSIKAGQISAAFDLEILEDMLLDGTQTVFINADAEGYRSGKGTIEIVDNEAATLTITVPEWVNEDVGVLHEQSWVRLSAAAGKDITVLLSSDDTSEVVVPSHVVIPKGQTNALFDITVIHDAESDGTQTATIKAWVSGWISIPDTIKILDQKKMSALYFLDYGDPTTDPVTMALENAGYAVVFAVDYEDFEASLNYEEWNLVVLMNQNAPVEDTSNFLAYVATGGKAIMTDWSQDAELGQAFGVTYTENENEDSVSIIYPFLTEGLTNPLPLQDPGVLRWSMGMRTQEIIVGEFPSGNAAIVLGNQGNTLAVGFLRDCIENQTEAVQFYENLISMLDLESMTLTLPETAKEGDGVLQGTVTVEHPATEDLNITLSSDNASEVDVSSELIIYAGQTSGRFDIIILDDELLDGEQKASITASIPGYSITKEMICVMDNETAVLSLKIPDLAIEGDGILKQEGILSLSRAPDKDIPVYLSSDDTTEVTVPETVIIPAHQTDAHFDLTIVYDGEIDDTQTVSITASVPGWNSAQDTIQVQHQEIDFLTEEFDEDNDLAYQKLIFTPDETHTKYRLCVEPAESFENDPQEGSALDLMDDDYQEVNLSGESQIMFYGETYSSFYVGSDGNICFSSCVNEMDRSLSFHFQSPRISALLDDLNPEGTSSISWQQLDESLVITYENIPEYMEDWSLFKDEQNANNFQIQIFFNGVIHITYLNISIMDGIVGLSPGNGLAENFIESNLSDYALCPPDNMLFIDIPELAVEGDAVLERGGTVRIQNPISEHLIVELASDQSSKVSVPAAALILAGKDTAFFDLAILEDSIYNGIQIVTITASAPGFSSGTGMIRVADNDPVPIPGDVNHSGIVDLKDAVLSFQVITLEREDGIYYDADVNGDKDIGLEEAVFILKILAERGER